MRASCFLACWTAKEAYVKAHGGGLSVPLDGFAIIPDPEQLQLKLEVFGKPAESERWSMWRLELPEEFRGALAVEGQVGRVRTGRFEF
jgi:4'-phosphopantetheinyl transferase